MAIVIVDETMEAVAGVWRHERGRALAMIVGAVAAVAGGIADLVNDYSPVHPAAVGFGIVVFGVGALAPYAELLRPVPPPPLHPVSRDDVISELEAIMLRRFALDGERMDGIEARQEELDAAARVRDQRITDFLVAMSSASGFVSSEAERLRETSNS